MLSYINQVIVIILSEEMLVISCGKSYFFASGMPTSLWERWIVMYQGVLTSTLSMFDRTFGAMYTIISWRDFGEEIL